MAVFLYEAFDGDGRLAKGRVTAPSQREAETQLEARALAPVSVVPAPAADAPKRKGDIQLLPRRAPSKRAIALVIRQLAVLVRAGLSLDEVAEALAEAQPHPQLRARLEALGQDLRRGETFSNAFKRALPKAPGYAAQLAEMGEATGQLGTALSDAADQFDAELALREEIRNALSYPLLLVVTGISAVAFIFVVVVPQFADLIEGDVSAVPLLSRVVIGLGLVMTENAAAFGVGGLLAVAIGVVLARQPVVRRGFDRALLAAPGLGAMLRAAETGRWASLTAALLTNRVPLLTALDMAREGVRYDVMRAPLARVSRAVRSGAALSDALDRENVLDRTAVDLARVGERAGALPDLLRQAGALYADEAKNRTRRLVALIEPLAILLIAGIVGVIVIAIMLALTSVYEIAL
ncbi:MAG: type II secretion system F family protein [Maricaulaceae bacterium]